MGRTVEDAPSPVAHQAGGRAPLDLKSVGDALTSLAIVIDEAGRVQGWNAAAERLLRIARSDVIGRRLAELTLPFTTNHLQECLAAGEWTRRMVRLEDLPYLDADGRPRVLALTIHPVRNPDESFVGAIIMGRDVTSRALEEQREVQRRKIEALATLAGGLAHELNTPVQFIASNLEFLDQALADLHDVIRQASRAFENSAGRHGLDEELDAVDRSLRDLEPEQLFEDVEAAVGAIRDGWQRIARIVAAMRDFAGIDYSESLVDVARIIRSTTTIVGAELRCDEQLEVDLAEDLPSIPGNAEGLARAFYQILRNAVEAARKSGTDRAAVRVSAQRVDDAIEVRIDDSGRGLTEREVERIFDPFYTTKEVGQGTGQGLSIALGVVRRHGGTITVSRSDLGGARFVVRLPLVQAGALQEAR